jgi:hypothetical protein
MQNHVRTAFTSRNLSVSQICFNNKHGDASDIAHASKLYTQSKQGQCQKHHHNGCCISFGTLKNPWSECGWCMILYDSPAEDADDAEIDAGGLLSSAAPKDAGGMDEDDAESDAGGVVGTAAPNNSGGVFGSTLSPDAAVLPATVAGVVGTAAR